MRQGFCPGRRTPERSSGGGGPTEALTEGRAQVTKIRENERKMETVSN